MKFLCLPVILSIIAYLPKGHGFRIGDYLKETPDDDLQNPDEKDEKEETDNSNTASSETCLLSFEPTESPNVHLGIPINFKLPYEAGLLAAEFNGRVTGYYLTNMHKPKFRGIDNKDSVECSDENPETTDDLYPNKVDANNNQLNLINKLLKQQENVKENKHVTLNSTEGHKQLQLTTMNNINQTESPMIYLKINSTTIPLKQIKINDTLVEFEVMPNFNKANQTNNSFTHKPILFTQTPEDNQNKFTTPNNVTVTNVEIASGQLNNNTVNNKKSFIIKMMESIVDSSSSGQFNHTQMSKISEGGNINIEPTQATMTVPEYIKYVEAPTGSPLLVANDDQHVTYNPPTPESVAPVVDQPLEANNDQYVYYMVPTQAATTEVAPVVNLFVVANDVPPEPNVIAQESISNITEVGILFVNNENSTNSIPSDIISSKTVHTEFGSPTKNDIVDLPGTQNPAAAQQLPQFEAPTKIDIGQLSGMQNSQQLPQFEAPTKIDIAQVSGMQNSQQLPQFEATTKFDISHLPGIPTQLPQFDAPTKIDIGHLPDMQNSPQLPQFEVTSKIDIGGLPGIQNLEQANLALPQHQYIQTDYVPSLNFNYDYLQHQIDGTDFVNSDSNISLGDIFHNQHNALPLPSPLPLHDNVMSAPDLLPDMHVNNNIGSNILVPDYSLTPNLYEGNYFLEHDSGDVTHSISDEVPILEHHTSSHEIHEIPMHIGHADYEDEY